MKKRIRFIFFVVLLAAVAAGIFAAQISASDDPVKEANKAMNRYFSGIEQKNKKEIMDVIKDTRQGSGEEIIEQSIAQIKGFKGKILYSEKVDDQRVMVTIEITDDSIDKYMVIDVPVIYEDGKWFVVLEEAPNQRFDLERKK